MGGKKTEVGICKPIALIMLSPWSLPYELLFLLTDDIYKLTSLPLCKSGMPQMAECL